MLYGARASHYLLGLFSGLLALTAYIGYDYYKIFAWPTADAVVVAIDEKCTYARERPLWDFRSGLDLKRINCDAKEEAAKLIAVGYRKESGTSYAKWIVYEPEAGRRVRAILDQWPDGAGDLAVGRPVRVRYNPSMLDHVEAPTEPGRKGLILVILVIGLVGVGCVLPTLTWEH